MPWADRGRILAWLSRLLNVGALNKPNLHICENIQDRPKYTSMSSLLGSLTNSKALASQFGRLQTKPACFTSQKMKMQLTFAGVEYIGSGKNS